MLYSQLLRVVLLPLLFLHPTTAVPTPQLTVPAPPPAPVVPSATPSAARSATPSAGTLVSPSASVVPVPSPSRSPAVSSAITPSSASVQATPLLLTVPSPSASPTTIATLPPSQSIPTTRSSATTTSNVPLVSSSSTASSIPTSSRLSLSSSSSTSSRRSTRTASATTTSPSISPTDVYRCPPNATLSSPGTPLGLSIGPGVKFIGTELKRLCAGPRMVAPEPDVLASGGTSDGRFLWEFQLWVGRSPRNCAILGTLPTQGIVAFQVDTSFCSSRNGGIVKDPVLGGLEMRCREGLAC